MYILRVITVSVSSRRVEAVQAQHELIEAGAQRCDAAPVQLISEMLMPTVRTQQPHNRPRLHRQRH